MGQQCCGSDADYKALQDIEPVPSKQDQPDAPREEVVIPATSELDDPAVSVAVEVTPLSFHLEIHSATLARSFATIGWMDPYAIVALDDREVGRTKTAAKAHKKPTWDAEFNLKEEQVPGQVSIAVWDKNNFHKDVLCGSVTVPCSRDMGLLDHWEFELVKRGQVTGTICLTLLTEVKEDVGLDGSDKVKRRMKRMRTSVAMGVGMEFDHLSSLHSPSGQELSDAQRESRKHLTRGPISLVEVKHAIQAGGEEQQEKEEEEAQPKVIKTPSGRIVSPDGTKKYPFEPLLGSWKCVDTWDLDVFLKASGTNVFQRKVALAAKWPAWEFNFVDGKICFINHSFIGDLKDEFKLDEEYQYTDGHGHKWQSTATWTSATHGGTLRIVRQGVMGHYSEERTITDDSLVFTLTNQAGVSWGRAFEHQ